MPAAFATALVPMRRCQRAEQNFAIQFLPGLVEHTNAPFVEFDQVAIRGWAGMNHGLLPPGFALVTADQQSQIATLLRMAGTAIHEQISRTTLVRRRESNRRILNYW